MVHARQLPAGVSGDRLPQRAALPGSGTADRVGQDVNAIGANRVRRRRGVRGARGLGVGVPLRRRRRRPRRPDRRDRPLALRLMPALMDDPAAVFDCRSTTLRARLLHLYFLASDRGASRHVSWILSHAPLCVCVLCISLQ